jgi:hypothetical protein
MSKFVVRAGRTFAGAVGVVGCVAGVAGPCGAQVTPIVIGVGRDFYTIDRPIQSNSCTGALCFGGPTEFIFIPRGVGLVVTFSQLTGTGRVNQSWPLTNADGGANQCGPGNATDLLPRNGFSGIVHTTRAGFLAGAFIGTATPLVGSEPPALTFTGDAFATLSPLMQQTFYIGDGRSATNQVQQFNVPAGASRLVLGVPDGCCVRGAPGSYCDNSGQFISDATVSGCLVLSGQSSGRTVCGAGGTASFSVTITGTGVPAYQWRRNGVPIPTSGPGGNPSAASATLVLTNVQPEQAGSYDCVISAGCGSFSSFPVPLNVPPACCDSIDFNDDDSFFDPADINGFLIVFSEGPCPSGFCNDIDFNNDGSFFDPCDIESFLLVFSEGPCTLCG